MRVHHVQHVDHPVAAKVQRCPELGDPDPARDAEARTAALYQLSHELVGDGTGFDS